MCVRSGVCANICVFGILASSRCQCKPIAIYWFYHSTKYVYENRVIDTSRAQHKKCKTIPNVYIFSMGWAHTVEWCAAIDGFFSGMYTSCRSCCFSAFTRRAFNFCCFATRDRFVDVAQRSSLYTYTAHTRLMKLLPRFTDIGCANVTIIRKCNLFDDMNCRAIVRGSASCKINRAIQSEGYIVVGLYGARKGGMYIVFDLIWPIVRRTNVDWKLWLPLWDWLLNFFYVILMEVLNYT